MTRCLRIFSFRRHINNRGTSKIAQNLIQGDTCDVLFFAKGVLELDYEGNALITLVV